MIPRGLWTSLPLTNILTLYQSLQKNGLNDWLYPSTQMQDWIHTGRDGFYRKKAAEQKKIRHAVQQVTESSVLLNTTWIAATWIIINIC